MHCISCSARQQRVLSGKTGVQCAEVSFDEEQASREFDSVLISADQLQEAVEKAGFKIAEV